MGIRSDEELKPGISKSEHHGRMKMKTKSSAEDTAEPMRDYTQDTRATSVAEMRYTGEMTRDMAEKHPGFYRGPKNQTLVAGTGERKPHEDHHPAVKMFKGKY